MVDYQGNIRVWWIRNEANEPEYFKVITIQEAKDKIRKLTEEDLKDSSIGDNTGGLEVYRNDEWEEYSNDEGQDIMEIIEEEDEKAGV